MDITKEQLLGLKFRESHCNTVYTIIKITKQERVYINTENLNSGWEQDSVRTFLTYFKTKRWIVINPPITVYNLWI